MSRRRDPFSEIQDVLDRLSRRMQDEFGEQFETGGPAGVHVDVAERDDDVVVTADLPGFDREDIEVTARDRRLNIEAERETATETEDGEDEAHYYRRERRRESVSRTVSLPVDVEETEASATYENGVLTVTLPVAEAGDEGHSISIG